MPWFYPATTQKGSQNWYYDDRPSWLFLPLLHSSHGLYSGHFRICFACLHCWQDILSYDGFQQAIWRSILSSSMDCFDYTGSIASYWVPLIEWFQAVCEIHQEDFLPQWCALPLLAWLAIIWSIGVSYFGTSPSLAQANLGPWRQVVHLCSQWSQNWFPILCLASTYWLQAVQRRDLESQTGYRMRTPWHPMLHHLCHCWCCPAWCSNHSLCTYGLLISCAITRNQWCHLHKNWRCFTRISCHKASIIESGGRQEKKGIIDNWLIPKLEFFQSIVLDIHSNRVAI